MSRREAFSLQDKYTAQEGTTILSGVDRTDRCVPAAGASCRSGFPTTSTQGRNHPLALDGANRAGGLVFTTATGTAIDQRNLSARFERLVKRSKVKGISFHGMCHTHATGGGGGQSPASTALAWTGTARAQTGPVDDSGAYARRAIEAAPHSASGYAELARVLLAAGSADRALAALAIGLRCAPGDPDLIALRAAALAAVPDGRAVDRAGDGGPPADGS